MNKKQFRLCRWIGISVLISVLTERACLSQEIRAQIVERNRDSRTWQSVSADGQSSFYTELSSGVCYQDDAANWHDSDPSIELHSKGYGSAIKMPHKIIFSPDLSGEGAVDMLTQSSKRIRSTLRGLAYYDAGAIKSVWIAEVDPSAHGELRKPNEVVWLDALKKIKASVRYRVGSALFEQDVILHEQPPTPVELGLLDIGGDDSQVFLQTWTEFFEAPTPTISSRFFNKAGMAGDNGQEEDLQLVDDQIDFGDGTVMGNGKIYLEDENGNNPVSIMVGKRWITAKNGRMFLVESVSYGSIRPWLESLPKGNKSAMSGSRFPVLQGQVFPPKCPISESKDPIQLAKADAAPLHGLVLDYITLSTATNMVIKGDTTYYVSGNVNLSQTTTLEGGAVIKYTNGAASINILGPIDCRATSYRPTIFTSMNDDSVGDKLPWSSGTPTINGGNPCLYFNATAEKISHVRFLYAQTAIIFDMYSGHEVSHAQFIHCGNAIQLNQTDAKGLNVLMSDISYGAYAAISGTFKGEHITYDNISNLRSGATVTLTNSLLVNVRGTPVYSGDGNWAVASASGIFQTVGAGNYYLVTDSPYRNVGKTNINAVLAQDIKNLTTMPPVLLTNDFTSDTVLFPQAQRDVNDPDCGYHYDPLDYLLSGLNVGNAKLSLTNGVAIGVYGVTGFNLQAGARLNSEGTPFYLNRLVRYQAVQEQATVLGGTPESLMRVTQNYSPLPEVRMRFTDISQMSGSASGNHILNFNTYYCVNPFALTDCQLRGGRLYSMPYYNNATGLAITMTNTLMQRVSTSLTKGYSGDTTPLNIYAYNNLFYGGSLYLVNNAGNGTWNYYDNLFDNAAITVSGYTFNNDYNGYINTSPRLGSGISNVVVATYSYARGNLGDYYQSATDFQNRGSRLAGLAGLYHYTTLVNQSKEVNSQVDIGLHYVACTGSPLVTADSDSDGIPDYLEDRNGNGSVNSQETNWNDANDMGLRVLITRPRAGLVAP